MTFDEYQTRAHESSLITTFPDPLAKLHTGASEEFVQELLCDNQGRMFLHLFGLDITNISSNTKQHAIKEAGDGLWYVVEHETWKHNSLGNVATAAISRMTEAVSEQDDMEVADFDELVLAHGGSLSVIDHKIRAAYDHTLSEPSNEAEKATEIRLDSVVPGYVLMRLFGRYDRLLRNEQGLPPLAPYGNADFDPPETLDNAPGDILLALSYVAQRHLDSSLLGIFEQNLVKTTRRVEDGTVLGGSDPDRSRY